MEKKYKMNLHADLHQIVISNCKQRGINDPFLTNHNLNELTEFGVNLEKLINEICKVNKEDNNGQVRSTNGI